MGKKCISIVVPMYNEQESLQILYRELNRVTREMGDYDFEYLFVNDGSKDATLQKIRELAAEDERVHYLSFSRNFGKEAALLAGLSCAKGDYVTTMDADLQDPPSLLPQMAAMLEAGDCDNVATRRVNRQGEPKIRSFFARMFYKVMRKLSHIVIADGLLRRALHPFYEEGSKGYTFACEVPMPLPMAYTRRGAGSLEALFAGKCPGNTGEI